MSGEPDAPDDAPDDAPNDAPNDAPDDAPFAWCRPFADRLAHDDLDRAGAIAWLGTVRSILAPDAVQLDGWRPEIATAVVHAHLPATRPSDDVHVQILLTEAACVPVAELPERFGVRGRPRHVARHDYVGSEHTSYHAPAGAPYQVQVSYELDHRAERLVGLRWVRTPVPRPGLRPSPAIDAEALRQAIEALPMQLPPRRRYVRSVAWPPAPFTPAPYEAYGVEAFGNGDFDTARTHFEAALAVRQAMRTLAPDARSVQHDIAELYDRLSDVAVAVGDLPTAREHLRARVLGLRDLGEAERAEQIEMADAYAQLGDLERQLARHDDARGWFEHALALVHALMRGEPERARWRHDEIALFHKLGDNSLRAAQVRDARGWFAQALDASDAYAAGDPLDPGYAFDACLALAGLADATSSAAPRAAARACYERLAERRVYHGYLDFAALGQRLAAPGRSP